MEEIIRKNLDFLCIKYGMKYSNHTFENYLSKNAFLDTYSYYNENGCFSILSIEARGDLNFAYFNSIDFLKMYVEPEFLGRHKYKINVSETEKCIWEQHEKIYFFKNPFFWWSKKRIFKALSEVIEAQIVKTGQFYDIKVKGNE